MKLTAHSKIFTMEGQDVGSLNRVVIDPRTNQVTHIVFEKGMLSKEEFVLPVQQIDHVDEQGIHLSELPVENKIGFTPFKDEEFIVTDESALADQGYTSDEAVGAYYYYPPLSFGSSGLANPNDTYMYTPNQVVPSSTHPGIPVSGEPPVQRKDEENIPEGNIAMKEGARVISKDDKQVGSVEKVILNPNNNKISHLIIGKGLLLKEHKVVPADWVDDYSEDEVFLAVNGDLVTRLPDYKGE
jgi:uncharacterized protein YrrD